MTFLVVLPTTFLSLSLPLFSTHDNTARSRSSCFYITSTQGHLQARTLISFTMRYSFGLAALAALASASDVHDLTKDTFEPFVKENDLVLAECMSYISDPSLNPILTL